MKDADGGLTIYIQNDSPGDEKESNWLPRHYSSGAFLMVMRTYIPGPEIVEQKWAPPAVQVESKGQYCCPGADKSANSPI